jgi:hypothetical protein
MTSELSRFIVLLLLTFLLVGSGVLLWDGLSTAVHHGRAMALHDHARGRLAVGIVGFAIAAWIVLGVLTHAR